MLKLRYLIIIALLIRESFSFWTGHPYDFEMLARVGKQLALGKPLYVFIGPYPDISFWPHVEVGYAYPPVYAYYCLLAYLIYSSIGINFPFLYYFLLKQPIIIGDVLNGYLIYKIGLKFFNNNIKYSIFWLFNPITIIFSSLWGIPHSLAITFILVFILNYRSNYSLLYLIFAFLIIGLPFIYLIAYLILFLSNRKFVMKNIGYFLILGVIIPILSLFPFQLFNQLTNITLAVEDVFFKKTLGQFNAFMIFYYLYYLDSNLFFNTYVLAVNIIPYFWLPTLIISLIFYKIKKVKEINFNTIINFFLLTTLIFLITRQNVNEQYILYFLAICLANYIMLQKSDLKLLFLLIQINALVFIATNNPFLIRFFTPLDQNLYFFDIKLTTTEPFQFIRYTIMTICGILNTIFLTIFLIKFLKKLNF
jgi:hypothetical protein